MDAGHQRSELHPPGDAGQITEGVVAFEHRLIYFADALYLEEVVHHPEAREARLIGGPADLGQFRADPRRAFRPTETRHLQTYAHVSISSRKVKRRPADSIPRMGARGGRAP